MITGSNKNTAAPAAAITDADTTAPETFLFNVISVI
jgi:hypothetical protein